MEEPAPASAEESNAAQETQPENNDTSPTSRTEKTNNTEGGAAANPETQSSGKVYLYTWIFIINYVQSMYQSLHCMET